MKAFIVVLVLANLAMAGYIVVRETATDPDKLIAKQQLNADQVRIVPPHAPVVAPPTPAATAPSTSQAAPAACIEWDGLGASDVAAAQAAIDAMALGDRVRRTESSVAPGYWVYIPPAKTRAGMDKKIEELKERGIADFAGVLETGRWRFAVSMGWFRNEDGARKYLASLREKGVRSAQLIQRDQKIPQVTFFIREPTDAQARHLNEMKAQYPASELRVVECPDG